MTNHWIDPKTSHSLAVLVESVTVPLLIKHDGPVCLELDIDVKMRVPADASRLVDLIKSLVGQSLAEMSDGGDLTITACETTNGVEVEIADTGCDVQRRAKSRPLAAAAIGATMQWKNCPQGGGSVTVTFPPKAAQSHSQHRRAA
ncbi:ATP-binding protein [Rubripirellula reticaptiva]|uniref:Uncharacterized protein n=1 Tax=Rubripirellula reticaptiva TaxID=2528013 RepID=A0A5C6FD38_9BACT|nr:ATP-binding protein [Rubripirellula reticaptiva]TWU57511.1 hypothetical protein Poly59_04180 [Rubripirellula reticaptiva]